MDLDVDNNVLLYVEEEENDEYDEKECDCSSIFLRHGVHQDRGRRTAMEDTHMIEHHFTELVAREMKTTSAPVFFPLDLHSVYFGLFDGHAGVAAAEFCKRNLHRNIARSIPTCQNMAEAMSQGFLLTDQQFLDSARLNNEESGSVCVSVICSGDTLHIAHTGDSRAVLCRAGNPVFLTLDHKPTCDGEKARVEKNGGTVEWDMLNGVLEVSRAIGDFDRDLGLKTRGLTALPETKVVKLLDADEFMIIACDGLWDVIDSSEAISFARAHLHRYDSVDAASEFLVREALRRQSEDNITVIIIAFQKYDASSCTDRIVPRDATVCDLPAHAVLPSDKDIKEEMANETTPMSSRRRPRFSAKGLAHVRGLLG